MGKEQKWYPLLYCNISELIFSFNFPNLLKTTCHSTLKAGEDTGINLKTKTSRQDTTLSSSHDVSMSILARDKHELGYNLSMQRDNRTCVNFSIVKLVMWVFDSPRLGLYPMVCCSVADRVGVRAVCLLRNPR